MVKNKTDSLHNIVSNNNQKCIERFIFYVWNKTNKNYIKYYYSSKYYYKCNNKQKNTSINNI